MKVFRYSKLARDFKECKWNNRLSAASFDEMVSGSISNFLKMKGFEIVTTIYPIKYFYGSLFSLFSINFVVYFRKKGKGLFIFLIAQKNYVRFYLDSHLMSSIYLH